MKKLIYILPSLLLLAGCQSQPKEEVEIDNSPLPVETQEKPSLNEKQEENNNLQENTENQNEAQEPEKELKTFETIEDAVRNITNGTDKNSSITKPVGFERFSFSQEEPYDVSPDGFSAPIYVLVNMTKKGEKMLLNDQRTFYIETLVPPACFPECDEPASSEFFGPYDGPIEQMLQ